ncbi:hypothetical protein OROHE_004818 [Orobanche hederae]
MSTPISSVILLVLLCFPFHACNAGNIGDPGKVDGTPDNIHKKNDEKLSRVTTELFIPKATEDAKGENHSTHNEVFGSDYQGPTAYPPTHNH